MKRAILLALLLHFSVCNAQDWAVKFAYGQLLTFPKVEATVMTEVSYRVSYLFTFALDTELFSDRESNVTAMLKTHPINNISLCTGFGWGHKFTNEVTDHNYHTYSIGVETWASIPYTRLRFSVTPMCEWRTFAAHIGMRREFFRLALQFGISYHF